MHDTLVPLFEEHNVDLVLNGHEHSYERTKEINGVTYIVTGGGGNSMRAQANDTTNTAAFETVHHFVGIVIRKNSMKIKAIDQNGFVFDEIMLKP